MTIEVLNRHFQNRRYQMKYLKGSFRTIPIELLKKYFNKRKFVVGI